MCMFGEEEKGREGDRERKKSVEAACARREKLYADVEY